MFVTIETDEGHEGIFERFKDLFREPLVEKRKVEVPNALPFYIIKAKSYHGICPWEKVEEAAGALRSRVILPSETVLPKESSLRSFEPTVFFERLLFNTAAEAIEKMQLDPCRVSITVFDENAYLIDLIEKLVPLASRLRIITNCGAAYDRLGDYLFERFGISIFVSGRADNAVLSSTFIISASGKNVPLIFSGVLFSNKKEKLMNAVVMSGKGFSLPKIYAELLPKNVEPELFAGALYELCGADELGMKGYETAFTV